MAHSIPDNAGVVVEANGLRILHTSDYKLDHTPIDGFKTDVGRLAELGNEGIDLMLGDSTNAERPGFTRSDRVNPGRSAFVESPRSRSTPRLPNSASRPTSVFSPSTGVWSSFQSPVWRTRPAAVSTTTATQSGIECAIRTKSSVNEPTRICSFVTASCSSVDAERPCSSSFDLIRPSVSFVAITLSQSTWRKRYGRPPTWPRSTTS